MSHKFHLFKKLQKCLRINLISKNNGLVLLFKTIFGYRICFLSSFTTNGEDRHELKLEKIGPNFSSCSAMLAKITIQIYGWRSLLSYADVSLSMKMCAQRKAGRRQRARPAVSTLPKVPCSSSPVTRVSRSPLPCEKRSV